MYIRNSESAGFDHGVLNFFSLKLNLYCYMQGARSKNDRFFYVSCNLLSSFITVFLLSEILQSSIKTSELKFVGIRLRASVLRKAGITRDDF